MGLTVINFIQRKPLHALVNVGEQDLSQTGALAMNWVYDNCGGDLQKSALELMVEAFQGDDNSGEAEDQLTNKDLFDLPETTREVGDLICNIIPRLLGTYDGLGNLLGMLSVR